jgi:hypothetical protein
MFVSFSEYGASTVSPGSLNQDLGGDSSNILQVERVSKLTRLLA